VYVQPTPGGPPPTYTLAEGEFPFCIARRFDVNQNELLTLNGLTVDTLVGPGLELQIPQTGNPFDGTRALHEHPTNYKIQSDDTLNTIACYFGDVSPDMIALQNGLTSTDLPPGEVLVIP
jgi:LysM repeat protein